MRAYTGEPIILGGIKNQLMSVRHVARLDHLNEDLPMLNLSEAARVSGQSKSTIWRAVNSGRLSVTRTYSGDYEIDPAELHRVFFSETADKGATTVSVKRDVSVKGDATELARAETALQIDRLFQVGELIRNELDNNRDAWRTQADRLRQLVG